MTNMKIKLRKLLERMPRLKALIKFVLSWLPNHGVSTGYVEIDSTEALRPSNSLHRSWKNDNIPDKQRILVDRQLAEYRQGVPVPVFDVLVQSLRPITLDSNITSMLEIGCSSGYYGEVMKLAGIPVRYSGCDFSEAFIRLARECYPDLSFDVQDATRLGYENGAFDIVVSGCCLLHIPDYQSAIAETARVAHSHVIFHRTPIVSGPTNKYYRKFAYGLETVEIHFSEPHFLELLDAHGLHLTETHTLDESTANGTKQAVKTYVCQKK